MTAPAKHTVLGNLEIERAFFAYDGPKLFLCSSEGGQIYLANAVEELDDQLIFLYLPLSRERLPQVVSGAISLREALLQAEAGLVWKVVTSYPTTSDPVSSAEAIGVSEIMDRWLPDPAARLDLPSPTQESFSPERLRGTALEQSRTLMALQLEVNDDLRTEYSVRPLSKFLKLVQENFDAQAQEIDGSPTTTGPIPAAILNKTELALTDLQAASFVLVFAPRLRGGWVEEPLLKEAADQFLELLAKANDLPSLKVSLEQMGQRARAKLRDLFEEANDQNSGLRLHIADSTGVRTTSVIKQNIEGALSLLHEFSEESNDIELTGLSLVGFNIRAKSFELSDPVEGGKFSGRVDEELLDTVEGLTVGGADLYQARLRQTLTWSSFSSDPKQKYRLLRLVPQSVESLGG